MSHSNVQKFGRSVLGAIALALTFAASPGHAAICKVSLDDIGTIIGKGRTQNLAFEDAATKCFDKKRSKLRSAASLDEETGLNIIDICANVRCES